MVAPFRVSSPRPKLLRAACLAAVCALWVAAGARAQVTTNPVDRKVTNPITDTPNVNPLQQDPPPVRPKRPAEVEGGMQSTEGLDVRAGKQNVSGPENARVIVYEGNVDARVGIYRLQADKVTVYEAKNLVIAEGNVVFDQGQFQRITGSRAEWNYETKTGFFVNAAGFSNQTDDGTIIYFTADRVDKIAGNKVVVLEGEITACGDDEVPKWSFRTRRSVITMNDRVRGKNATFRIKGVPVGYLPFFSVSLKPRDRASGFLTPTFSGSGKKGFRISNAYYKTLGRSADITFSNDIFTGRGVGVGADLRTRANSRSYLNVGFYAIKDRIFGAKAGPNDPDQGGSSFYVDGVHYFPNGFLAAADVNITSNLDFRAVFSDSIQQAISPEERSQVFVNKNGGDYSLNFIARTQVVSVPSVRVRTRSLPGVSLDKRPSQLRFFEKLPLYFSFEGSVEGVSRKETVTDLIAFNAEGNANPIITPSIVQRLDFYPKFSVPFDLPGGWGVTATAKLRSTYYSNSLEPPTRLVLSRDVVRGYGEFELDVRPPALARNFRRGENDEFWFRHVVEPYFIYRKIGGISNFERIIRFDSTDAVADTNEMEFGLTNRFFSRRSTENVSGRVSSRYGRGGGLGGTRGDDDEDRRSADERRRDERRRDEDRRDDERQPPTTDETAQAPSAAATGDDARQPLARQPYEFLSITLRQKYFFDRTFGGALVPGRRNQFYPINTFSGFTYGGVPRRFSPLFVEARVREPEKSDRGLYADVRMNLDVLGEGGGLRDLAVGGGLIRRVPKLRALEIFQTFYYTRAVTLAPSLRQFSNAAGNEPGTQQGSQWSPAFFLGDRERGLFGGASFFFDFQNRPGRGSSSLVSSVVTLGYTWDCCAVTAQNFTFNTGIRAENRVVFSFRLNGIGTFGTEQIGQHFR